MAGCGVALGLVVSSLEPLSRTRTAGGLGVFVGSRVAAARRGVFVVVCVRVVWWFNLVYVVRV